MNHQPDEQRYYKMTYSRYGRSCLKLPALSPKPWNNFGDNDTFDNCRNMIYRALDPGITHFDLASNYGHKTGATESKFGKILREWLDVHCDELSVYTFVACSIISFKPQSPY